MPKDYTWAGAIGEIDGLPLMMRVREVPKRAQVRKLFPHLVVITYAFETRSATGLPSKREYTRLEKFEAATFDALEAASGGLLVLVRTHRRQVEYYEYVASVARAVKKIDHSALAGPISLAAAKNDRWKEYDRAWSQLH